MEASDISFVKTNHSQYPDALLKEAHGLQQLQQLIALQSDNPLHIPDIFSVSESELIITAIKATSPNRLQLEQLGRGLAQLHRTQQPYFGLDEDNYIGPNPQINSPTRDWGEFFIQRRLNYQISLVKNHRIRANYKDILEHSSYRLREFLNEYCQHPSLVHGDLWQGNVMFDQHNVWLIDPAVYYGDREVDLAMTEMFGGFDEPFYTSYDKHFPRTEEYAVKRDIYNLYHYLNHYNLFGNNYLAGCDAGWRRIKQL